MAVVGSAHIIVNAITKNFERDVKKALEDLAPVFDKKGETSAEEFAKSFKKSASDNLKNMDPLRGTKDHFRDIGGRAAEAFSDGFSDQSATSLSTFDPFRGQRDIFDSSGETAALRFTTRFKQEIRLAFGDLSDEFEDFGKRAGDNFTAGFVQQTRGISAQVGNIFSQTNRALGGGRGFSGFTSSMVAARQQALAAADAFASLVTKSYFIGPAISVAAGAISSLVAGLVPLVAQLSMASQSLIVLPAGIAVIAQAAIVGKMAFNGLADAYKETIKRRQELFAATGMGNDLADEARSLIDYAVKARKYLVGLRQVAAQSTLPGFEQGLRALVDRVIPQLRGAIQSTGFALGGLFKQFAATVTESSNLAELKRVMETNADVVKLAGDSFSNLYDIFLSLLDAARPLTLRFATWVSTLTEGWKVSRDIKNATGELTNTFNRAGDAAAQIGRIFKNLGSALMTIGKAAAGPGSGGQLLMDMFEESTFRFKNFVNMVNQGGKLEQYFVDVAKNVGEISKLLVVVVKEFFKLGDDESIGKTAKALVPMVESLGRMATVLQEGAPSLAEFGTKFTELLEKFAESGSINMFFEILNKVLDIMNLVFGDPMVQKIFMLLAPMFAIVKALRLMRITALFFSRVWSGYFQKAGMAVDTLRSKLTSTGTYLQQWSYNTGRHVASIATGLRGLGTAGKALGQGLLLPLRRFSEAIGSTIASVISGQNVTAQAGITGRQIATNFSQGMSTVVGSVRTIMTNVKATIAANAQAAGFVNDRGMIQTGQYIGSRIATGLGMGLTAGLSGVAAGQSEDTLGKVLGFGSIAASAAMATATMGPIAGAAVGAIGLIGAAFGAQGAAAQKAKAEIQEYTDAIYDAALANESLAPAISDVLFTNFKDESNAVKETFDDLGLKFGELADLFAMGKDKGTPLIFENVSDKLKQLGIDLEALDITSLKQLETQSQASSSALSSALKDAGIDVDGFNELMGALRDESGETFKAIESAALDAAMAPEKTAEGFSTAAEAIQYYGQKISDVLQTVPDDASLMDRALGRLKGQFEDLGVKVGRIKEELQALLSTSSNFDELSAQLVQSAKSIAEELSQNIPNPTEKWASDTLAKQQYSNSIKSAIVEGLQSGALTGAADVNRILQDQIVYINKLDIPQAQKDQLIALVQTLLNDAELQATLKNLGISQEALTNLGATITGMEEWKNIPIATILSGEPLPIPEDVKIQLEIQRDLEDQNILKQIQDIKAEMDKNPLLNGEGANLTVNNVEALGKINFVIQTARAGFSKQNWASIGAAADQGIAVAFDVTKSAGMKAIKNWAAALPAEVKKILGVQSPSKVFKKIGSNIVDGLASGISGRSQFAVDAVSSMASDIAGVGPFNIGEIGSTLSFANASNMAGMYGPGGASSIVNSSTSKTVQNFDITVESPRTMKTARDVVREFQALSYRMGY